MPPRFNTNVVKSAQSALRRLGHAVPVHGTVDGATTRALTQVQSAAGLPVTGLPDPPTLAALGVSSSPTSSAAATVSTTSPLPPAPPAPIGGNIMSTSKAYKATAKRVPLVFSAVIAGGASQVFSVIPQFTFRLEHMVVDPGTAASVTLTPPSVGPNIQIAGGNNNTTFTGATFPPAQTKCMELGCDIASEGNQISVTAASTLTTGSATYSLWLMGTCGEQMNATEMAAHAKNVAAGITPAGNWSAGIAPAGSWTGPRS